MAISLCSNFKNICNTNGPCHKRNCSVQRGHQSQHLPHRSFKSLCSLCWLSAFLTPLRKVHWRQQQTEKPPEICLIFTKLIDLPCAAVLSLITVSHDTEVVCVKIFACLTARSTVYAPSGYLLLAIYIETLEIPPLLLSHLFSLWWLHDWC